MTEQEIMQLAKEAGMFAMLGPLSHLLDHEIACLQRFANLVAEREREACAKIAESTVCDTHIPTGVKIYGRRAAEAIRNRKETQ